MAQSDVMCSLLTREAHITAEGNITHEVRITFRTSGTHRSKNEKAVRWTAFVFVLYSLNRCHHGKVNKIKGVGALETGLSASLIDAELFMVLFLNFGVLFLLSFSLIFCNIYTAFLCTQHLRRLEKQA